MKRKQMKSNMKQQMKRKTMRMAFQLPLLVLMALLFTFSSCKKDRAEDLIIEQDQIAQQAVQDGKEEHRHCATEENFQMQLTADPGLKARRDAMEQAIQHKLSSRATVAVTIPVVVHVLYNTAAQNISDAQILSQIAVLNQDFSRTNPDAGNTPSSFQAVSGSTSIQFTLAKRDPAGNATSGIVRKATTVTSFAPNGSVKLNSMGGDDAWPCEQYLNIWVCNLSGALGYATYPGGNPIADGVVIRYNAFGNTGTLTSPYNMGRTATHEVAHWLNVYHIWGDAQCGDDLVADSPPQYYSNYGCPSYPKVSACSGNGPSGDMFMNYMDYSNDACMNMFTIGQTTRMNATLTVARASILTSLGGVAPTGTPPPACNVPAGLAASSVTSASASLNWISNGAISYNVRYKPTASSTWVSGSSTSTSFPVSGLTASTVYEFQVQSVCSSSSSAYSASGTFTTSSAPVVCNAPGGLTSSLVAVNSATISWASSGAISYNVRYKPVSATTWVTTSTSATSQSLSALLASTAYEFQVQGVCSGSLSAYSASATFTTTSAPIVCNVPGTLSSSSVTVSSAALSWASTSALSYNIRYKATSSANWITTTSTSASRAISGLSASTLYEFQVQSVCSGGSSAYSASATFTTPSAPIVCNVPGGLSSSSVTLSSAVLSWTSAGAVGYNVRYKSLTSATWLNGYTTSTSLPISGLSSATAYEFQVQSACSGGSSSYSASATLTTLAPVSCGIPSGLLSSSITASGATISWSSSGALNYSLRYRRTGTATWTNTIIATSSHTLSGLTEATTYEFQVQSNCSLGSSAFSGSGIFTTLTTVATCNVPMGLVVSNLTASGATLTWVSTGAPSYNVRYKPTTSTTWISQNVTSASSLSITGLASSTTYEFQIRSMCSGSTSAFSTSAFGTTLARSGGRGNNK